MNIVRWESPRKMEDALVLAEENGFAPTGEFRDPKFGETYLGIRMDRIVQNPDEWYIGGPRIIMKRAVKEMTVAEVAKELGYEVKIVRD